MVLPRGVSMHFLRQVRVYCTSQQSVRRYKIWKPAQFTLLICAGTFGTATIFHQNRRNQRKRLFENRIMKWWMNLSASDHFCYAIISLNVGIFLLWRIPRLQMAMEKFFISSTSKKSTLPLVLSGFSHIEPWHLSLNMLALWSFAPAFLYCLGCANSSNWAWCYYLSAGSFASMLGYYVKAATGSFQGSLGASGAIMAVVSLVVFNHPDSSVYLFFLPFVPIPAKWALAGVFSLDAIGLMRGWKVFDHAAHMGGVLFALLYTGVTSVCKELKKKKKN